MSKFEDLFEDLDVHTQVMDSAMSTATTLSTPEGQVDSLMKQVLYTTGDQSRLALDFVNVGFWVNSSWLLCLSAGLSVCVFRWLRRMGWRCWISWMPLRCPRRLQDRERLQVSRHSPQRRRTHYQAGMY